MRGYVPKENGALAELEVLAYISAPQNLCFDFEDSYKSLISKYT
ncbi:hypothetical protein [Candidatus Bathycorpusculum sp.]